MPREKIASSASDDWDAELISIKLELRGTGVKEEESPVKWAIDGGNNQRSGLIIPRILPC